MELSNAKIKYLLAIYQMAGPDGAVRSMAVADTLRVSRPCVSRMVAALAQWGMIEQKPRQTIRLSKKGIRTASDYQRQFDMLYPFFAESFGMEHEDARECTLAMLCHLPKRHLMQINDSIKSAQSAKPER